MSENFRPKIQHLGLEIPHFWVFRGKIEILSSSVGKLQLPSPPTSLTHDASTPLNEGASIVAF